MAGSSKLTRTSLLHNTDKIARDGVDSKPWLDDSQNAAWTFWDAADSWLPTWGKGADRGMTVKSVKMWRQGKCK